MRHSSSSATLAQMRQNFTRSITSSSTAERRRTSTGSAVSRWNAIRCAPFGPTPGSWPSSSMRLWTTPSYTSGPAREGAHLLLLQFAGRAVRIADCGEHEVSHRLRGLLRAGRIDGGGGDGEV